MKNLIALMAIPVAFSVASSKVFAKDKQYEVSVQCKGQVDSHRFIAFTSEFQTDKRSDVLKNLALSAEGKIQDASSNEIIDIQGADYQTSTQADGDFTTADSYGMLNYKKVQVQPYGEAKDMEASGQPDGSTCEPNEVSKQKVALVLTFTGADAAVYDSQAMKALNAKTKNGTLKVIVSCVKSININNLADVCQE